MAYPITLIVVGKMKRGSHRESLEHYRTLLKRFVRLTVVEVAESKKQGAAGLQEEARKIMQHLTSTDTVVLLREQGLSLTSVEFAKWLGKKTDLGHSLVFIIGSSEGLDRSLVQRFGTHLSLSPMTYSHDLAQILWHEQIYRGFSILQGTPYHK
jgi:23S rRNA (pseudouridine1915-N3)-methyltransferase